MVKKHFLDLDFADEPYKSMVIEEYPIESKQVIRFIVFSFLSRKANENNGLLLTEDEFYIYLGIYENVDIQNCVFDYDAIFNQILAKKCF